MSLKYTKLIVFMGMSMDMFLLRGHQNCMIDFLIDHSISITY